MLIANDGGCEWNPIENRPVNTGEQPHANAEVILGNGMWRLCRQCSVLPIFGRYENRKEINK